MSNVKAIPEGSQVLVPHLVVKDAAKAIDFYKTAFGATENYRFPMPGSEMIMHAELRIGDCCLYLCDEMPCPEGGESGKSPSTLGGSPVTLNIWTEDSDAFFEKAIQAGAEVTMPLQNMFWGDRYGRLRDPFGHEWSISTHKEDLSPEQIQQNALQFFLDITQQEK